MRRFSYIFFSIGLFLFSTQAFSISLEKVTDLQKDGTFSTETQRPIFLYVSSQGCPYCKRLERDIIAPMIKSGSYDEKILMRKILWEESTPIINFKGEEISPGDFLLNYNIMATPSILFLDKDGNEIAKRLNGYRSADLFWYYLDSSVDKAVEVLKRRQD